MKIHKLQKRACKVILDFNVDDSNEAMIFKRLWSYMIDFIEKSQTHV